MIMNKVNNKSAKAAPVMLIIGILFIAANLRAPLTSVGPLVSLIRDNLHISNTLAGTITSLPLFAFALFSPLIPRMARKFGTEVCFFGSVIILTLGILLRSYAGSFSLFLGTAIIGLAISASNVLMPSLIKKEFPNQVGVMTGLYSVSMSIFAALASGISIPLAVNSGLGWAGALKIWAVLSFISIIIWIPQLRKNSKMAVDNMAADTLEEVNKTNNIDEPTYEGSQHLEILSGMASHYLHGIAVYDFLLHSYLAPKYFNSAGDDFEPSWLDAFNYATCFDTYDIFLFYPCRPHIQSTFLSNGWFPMHHHWFFRTSSGS